jgi:hypothetical protein
MLSKAGEVDPKLDQIAGRCRPIWVSVHFDNNVVTFDDLHPTPPVGKWQAFTASFPPARSILDGKAMRPIDPAYSWGY